MRAVRRLRLAPLFALGGISGRGAPGLRNHARGRRFFACFVRAMGFAILLHSASSFYTRSETKEGQNCSDEFERTSAFFDRSLSGSGDSSQNNTFNAT
jgi:hypothetical protein